MFKGLKIGVGITGSFCSLDKMFFVLDELKHNNADVYIVLSNIVQHTDTRFYLHDQLIEDLKKYTTHPLITTIEQAELFGPKIKLDAFVIMPATSNTISKLANGICDSPVIMATKATLRNNKPIIIGMYTNDALSSSGPSWISLLNRKNFYFIPFGQDDFVYKPNSLLSDYTLAIPTICKALNKEQIQPVLILYEKN